MTTTPEPAVVRNRRPSPKKRKAIVEAARTVFLRDGFSRASVDAIAALAEVSKRTIYNHFEDKEQLLTEIVRESTASVAESFVAAAREHLTDVTDVEAALVAFGEAWLAPRAGDADHGALVRLVIAEATHHPEVVRVWLLAGPRHVRRELTVRLEELAGRGLLVLPDAAQAAGHFTALVHSPAGERSFYGTLPLTATEIDEIVRGGVRAFLRLYGA